MMPTGYSAKSHLRQRLIADIQKLFRINAEAPPELREWILQATGEMMRRAPTKVLWGLEHCHTRFLYVPEGTVPSQMPESAEWPAGWAEEIDRRWESLSGQARGNKLGPAWVLLHGKVFRYRFRYAIVHEWAHVMHRCGGAPNFDVKLDELFARAKQEDRFFPTAHSMTSPSEYLAESAGAWFDAPSLTDKDRDLKMLPVLEDLFGPRREIWPGTRLTQLSVP